MAALTTAQRAPLLGPDGEHLTSADISLGSSNNAVATFTYDPIYVVGVSAGTATLTARRLADNAEATLDVTVVNDGELPPFTISLGTPEPK